MVTFLVRLTQFFSLINFLLTTNSKTLLLINGTTFMIGSFHEVSLLKFAVKSSCTTPKNGVRVNRGLKCLLCNSSLEQVRAKVGVHIHHYSPITFVGQKPGGVERVL